MVKKKAKSIPAKKSRPEVEEILMVRCSLCGGLLINPSFSRMHRHLGGVGDLLLTFQELRIPEMTSTSPCSVWVQSAPLRRGQTPSTARRNAVLS